MTNSVDPDPTPRLAASDLDPQFAWANLSVNTETQYFQGKIRKERLLDSYYLENITD